MIPREYARHREELESLVEVPTPLLIRAIVRLWGTEFHSVTIPLQEESGYQIYLQAWKTATFYTDDHEKKDWDLLGLALHRVAQHLGLSMKKVLRRVQREVDAIDQMRWIEVDAGILDVEDD